MCTCMVHPTLRPLSDHLLKALIQACLKDNPKERPIVSVSEDMLPGCWGVVQLRSYIEKSEPKVSVSELKDF